MFNVLIKNQYSAMNVDAKNRTAVAEVNLQNGAIFALDEYSTAADSKRVWKVKQLAEGAKGFWMASSPEVVTTVLPDGTVLKGIDNNIRDFVNVAGQPFDAFKVMEDDILTFIPGDAASDPNASIIGKDILIAASTGFAFKEYKASEHEGAALPASGMYLQKVDTEKAHIGDGALVKTAITGAKYQVKLA